MFQHVSPEKVRQRSLELPGSVTVTDLHCFQMGRKSPVQELVRLCRRLFDTAPDRAQFRTYFLFYHMQGDILREAAGKPFRLRFFFQLLKLVQTAHDSLAVRVFRLIKLAT